MSGYCDRRHTFSQPSCNRRLTSDSTRATTGPTRYRPELPRRRPSYRPTGIPQFGLVAEQVEKVNPDLVARDEEGKPYTVRYEAVNAMLLNEFLKAHKKVETQTSEIADLKATVAEVKAALQAQAAQLQKVSDRLEASRLAPTVVANN